MEANYQQKHARKPVDIGREDLVDAVDSASGLDGEKEDHETSNLNDIQRRNLTPEEAQAVHDSYRS